MQNPALNESGSVFQSSSNDGGSQFTYPDFPAPAPMPGGNGPITTLAGPQGPEGPHDAYAPMAYVPMATGPYAPLPDYPLLSSDSSPEPGQSGGTLFAWYLSVIEGFIAIMNDLW